MSTLLEVSGVSVSFDGFKAINNLSFEIGGQELRAMIGPNGAGKTTFMDIVTGKTRPDEGHRAVRARWAIRSARCPKGADRARGRSAASFSAHRVRGPERARQPARGAEETGGRSRVLDRVERADRARVEALAEEIGLSDELERKAGILSHGQKQWLEIGMLLAQDPRLLLVDEPAAGMTTEEREHTADLLKRAGRNPCRRRGRT
jgi:urea transport system ATP-binding protein